ncbi:hypothetical protein Acr_17g0009890 [Actinidia rufa]|uniref:S-protein homolog n=1 Tax=Actinidia rufa TaxID=165716 RepID=A0A7J0DR48_9ERIC|nr:hypothetical protein Acr_00g0069260 [Actinidia rufa]GFZ05417.1 hypothetical protein Acr_17g0009890 [Actinidia rufa]
MMNYFYVPLLILAFFSLTQAEKHEIEYGIEDISGPFVKYTVHIVNGITPKPGSPILQFHCQSNDDDLGVKFPKPGEDFNWSFRENLIGSTLFFCSFSRGQQSASFDVFNHDLDDQCKQCYWLVKEDGFYFSDSTKLYQKRYNWK